MAGTSEAKTLELAITFPVLYGIVSQELGTTEFTNLLDENGLDFPIQTGNYFKKVQTKLQKYMPFSSNIFLFIYLPKKPNKKRKIKRNSRF